jgi:hypothetical protein
MAGFHRAVTGLCVNCGRDAAEPIALARRGQLSERCVAFGVFGIAIRYFCSSTDWFWRLRVMDPAACSTFQSRCWYCRPSLGGARPQQEAVVGAERGALRGVAVLH